MNTEIRKLYPNILWDNFANICNIPHPSKHEQKLYTYLQKWADEHHIEWEQDATGNMIFRAPATPGMENRTPVILQGHMDMVPQANSDKKHDFTTDPIETLITADGWVTANGTTLGADNGIGGAAALAVLLDKTVEHGPIEVLLTIDEETGMTGAFGLKAGVLKGKILLNLDSETEGELYVGCAGGLDATIEIDYQNEATPAAMCGVKLNLAGLKGGHSGMEINLGRGNANKLINRLLHKIHKDFGFRLSEFCGGNMRNAIPREAWATGAVPSQNVDSLINAVNLFAKTIKSELSATEENISLTIEKIDTPKMVMVEKDMQKIISTIYAMPNGVLRMSDSMKDLVETSNNMAIVKSDNGKFVIINLLRSSVDSAKEALGEKMTAIAELAGGRIALEGGYPGWKPNMESPILKTMQQVYHSKYGKEPQIMAIHAGLECGLFGLSYPNWDMISFGPTISGPHSPDEKVHIESVGKFWDFLVETLRNIPVQNA